MFFMSIMFFMGLLNILFLCKGVLNMLISLEFLMIMLFLIVMLLNSMVPEMIFFLVFSVGESVLGLILMLLKVLFSGLNFVSYDDF